MVTSAPTITTVGDLKASGHQQKALRHEIRDNLLAALREGRDPWPGLHGFEETVITQLERREEVVPDLVTQRLLLVPGCLEVADGGDRGS